MVKSIALVLLLGGCRLVLAETLDLGHIQAFQTQVENAALVIGKVEQNKRIRAIDAQLVFTGQFAYARGHGLYWAFHKPMRIGYWITPNQMFRRIGSNKTLQSVDNRAGPLLAEMLPALITLDLDWLRARFELSTDIQPDMTVLHLKPKSRIVGNVLNHITVTVRATHIERVAVATGDGDSTTYRFSEVAHSSELSPDFFSEIGISNSLPETGIN